MTRRVRLAVAFWIAAGVVAWNATFDLLVTRGVKEYLYRRAAYDAGQGPKISIDEVMVRTVDDGVKVASAVAALVTGAGLATIAALRPRRNDRA